MGFRGRGIAPSGGVNNISSSGNINGNAGNNDNNDYVHPHVHYWYRPRIFLYDKSFFYIELILMALLFVICFLFYLFGYNFPMPDAIKQLKDTYTTSLFMSVALSFVCIVLSLFLISKKEKLIKSLVIILVLSFISLLVFLSIRFYLDDIYNKAKFEQIYDEDYAQQYQDSKAQHLDLENHQINFINDREAFIKQNIQAYHQFQLKSIFISCIYFLEIIINVIILIHINRNKEKMDKVKAYDSALFDDVQNVKY